VGDADWRAANRANWDERVGIHLGPSGYDLAPLRAGRGRLDPIVAAELGPVEGRRILHLQCHFGHDTLKLAQRGAEVVGLDFSAPAIAAAQRLAAELGLDARARFVEADVYDAPCALAQSASFDRVFVTWGALCWLPDIERWARVVAHFLKPGGSLYLADAHPAAYVFDDLARQPDGMPGFFAPYFARVPIVTDDQRDYLDRSARLTNARQYNWIHPLGDIASTLVEAGLRLDWLHEHDTIVWQMFDVLVKDGQGMYRWPDRLWLPLAFSLSATRP
jgi:SAM-dependent methyltransferase